MPIIFPDNLFKVEKWKAFKGKYPPGSDIDHRIIIVFKYGSILRYFYVTSQVEKSIIFAICSSKTFTDKEKEMYTV